VVGWPIQHSLSPALHRAAYRDLGLDWTFEALPVERGGLREFVGGLDASWRGLAATMPHKEALLTLGEPEPDALLVGAANTLTLGPQPKVYNTDIFGMQLALRANNVCWVSSAVIIGAGATARSALVALSRMGLDRVCVQSRSDNGVPAMSQLARELGVAMTSTTIGEHEPCDVLVSTLPPRAADECAAALALGAACVLDVTYTPWPSLLATRASEIGIPVISGVDLLAGQALRQIELLTGGQTVAFERLRDAGWAELGARAAAASPTLEN
jgi:shikimate dehydrogenase